MALAESGTTPGVFTGTGTTTTIATTTFTPPAASLVVALVSGEKSTSAVGITVTDNSGLTNRTWRQMASATGGNFGGGAAVWVAYFPTAPAAAMKVTATFTNLTGGRFLDVRVITGADPTQLGAQGWAARYTGAGPSTGNIAVTTTAAGSLIYGISNSPQVATSLTAYDSNTTLLNSHSNTTDGATAVSWKESAATTSLGTHFYGGLWSGTGSSTAHGNLAAFEVMPLGATPGAPTIPTFVDGSVPHASDLGTINTNITNLYKLLQGGIRWQPYKAGAQGPRKPMCVLTVNNPTFSIGTGGGNIVHWDTALINTDNGWSAMNDSFVVCRTGGLWRVNMTAQIVGQASVAEVEGVIVFVGNTIASANANGQAINVNATVQVPAGNFFQFQLNSTVAGTVGSAAVALEWLSP